jgi:hypothetical protein
VFVHRRHLPRLPRAGRHQPGGVHFLVEANLRAVGVPENVKGNAGRDCNARRLLGAI